MLFSYDVVYRIDPLFVWYMLSIRARKGSILMRSIPPKRLVITVRVLNQDLAFWAGDSTWRGSMV